MFSVAAPPVLPVIRTVASVGATLIREHRAQDNRVADDGSEVSLSKRCSCST